MKTAPSTIADVARAAGVGVATVDRVINRRAQVRPATALRVMQAAEALGYRGAGLIRKRLDEGGGKHRLGFLLQKSGSEFFQLMAQALQQAGREAGGVHSVQVEYMDDLTPRRVVAQLRAMAGSVNALALVATEHPVICAAVEELAAEGYPVFSLVSDLSATGLAGHAGVDNVKVGRSAAWAIAHLGRRPAKVAVMVGSHRYACQEECETSFRTYFQQHELEFDIDLLDTLISLEDRHLAEETIHELLHRHPDLTGFYLAGGGIEGVLDGLRALGPEYDFVTVCHDLTPLTRAALADGHVAMVISHPRDAIAGGLVAAMCDALDSGTGPRRCVVDPLLFTPENI
ncbi:LacI family DNA-binding transcriptional regulator [Janthinobacterium sp. PSPC3-1]|uniref:LacI family DNA-binding transcriptional regulator n=1 Tax=Janthinobacterium sp. PSPC3-1 TaxID=2804653 RepID=UPI003CE93587